MEAATDEPSEHKRTNKESRVANNEESNRDVDDDELSNFLMKNDDLIYLMLKRVRLVQSGSWCMSACVFVAFIFFSKSFGFIYTWNTRPVLNSMRTHTGETTSLVTKHWLVANSL